MSSTEPPSRSQGRGQAHDTKSARDDLSSKGKVEKIREVDPDEEARKKRFMQYYKGVDEEGVQEEKPSPFDLCSKPPQAGEENGLTTPPSFKDVEDALVPSPPYSPVPGVRSPITNEVDEDEVTEGALPQSEDFWEDFDFPDQPKPLANLQETPGLTRPKENEGAVFQHRKKTEEIERKDDHAQLIREKKEEKRETHDRLAQKIKEPSPFGPPGKPREKKGERGVPHREEKKRNNEVQPLEKEKLPSPFEEIPTQPIQRPPKRRETIKEKEEGILGGIQEIHAIPIKSEMGGGGKGQKQGREEKILEIQALSLPQLPSNIEPMATSATKEVATYLTPSTVSLFYQMVGTIYVMQGEQGINRTEVVLNNPAYANSKFFGATITIEKYATAPDSFNIRLSGSHEAVVSFKENIPSLMNAFENGNFNFRIARIDAEYSIEKPLFRRKEKGEERGEAGESDLGERSKQ